MSSDDVDGKDRCLKIRGCRNGDFEDYENVFTEGGTFSDKVSSIFFHIPIGWKYELFDDIDFNGNCIELIGDGIKHFLPDLKKKETKPHYIIPQKFNDKIKSSRYVKI